MNKEENMLHQRKRVTALGLTLFLCASLPVRGGQEPKEAEKQEPVVIGATEVVVDVIVTDKKNRMLADLTLADFEVFEDSVKQTLKSVRLERRGEAAPESAAEGQPVAPAPDRPLVRPRPITNPMVLVFDNLSLSRPSQVFARRAAHDYIEHMAPDDRLAVFGIDTRLFLVQPFTSDKAALKKAVEQVTTGTSQQFASSAAAIERILQNTTLSSAAAGNQPEDRLAAAEDVRASLNEENIGAAMEAVLLQSLRSFETFEREVQARATVLALLALIQGQQLLPGRKTVILFSEGFAVPGSVAEQFHSVIGAANRANVALYTIDAGGLRVDSEGERVSRQLSALAEARSRGADPTRVEGGESMLGRAESLSRSNRESVLEELAEATGGLAIRNTNDLRSGLSRIDEDMRSYYILTYAPSNQKFDGRYRTIQVKVNRPDVQIRARAGYFALRTADASPVFGFEQPLFDVLAQAPPPQDFPVHLGAMHFPTRALAANMSVVAEIPASVINFSQAPVEEKKKKRDEKMPYVGELGIMALVKDAQGVVMRKLSQNFTLSYPADQLENIKKSNLIFYRTTAMSPGAYQVELVARDVKSGHASVHRASLRVPAPPSPTLRLSSIVPTKGGESLRAQERDPNNPFHFGQILMMPELDRQFSKSADQKMMFYFTVQATPSASVRAKVEFLQHGQVLAQAPGALPAPDPDGRIQFVAEFPLAPFPEGDYDVRITVEDGTNRASEQTSFTVVN
jgi:VWFA-related protein